LEIVGQDLEAIELLYTRKTDKQSTTTNNNKNNEIMRNRQVNGVD